MTMVHAKSNFIKVRIAIILSNCSPSMPESIEAIAILLFHTHILTNFADTDIYIRIETIRITVPLMEIEQVWFILVIGKVFLKCGLDKWFNSHFHIGIISTTITSLRPLIAYDSIL